jgi:hypothetical protein
MMIPALLFLVAISGSREGAIRGVLVDDSLGLYCLDNSSWFKKYGLGIQPDEEEYFSPQEVYLFDKRNVKVSKCHDFLCGEGKGIADSLSKEYRGMQSYRVCISHNQLASGEIIQGKISQLKWGVALQDTGTTNELIVIEKNGKLVAGMPLRMSGCYLHKSLYKQ